MTLRILMFGWEFPPQCSGGLGTACFGLTKALSKSGVEVTFVVPSSQDHGQTHVRLVSTNSPEYSIGQQIDIRKVRSILTPYLSHPEYEAKYMDMIRKGPGRNPHMYGSNLYEEVKLYSLKAQDIAKKEEFDIIHCHDWMTYQAGVLAKKQSGKPLVVHIHATEFDRTGGHPNQDVYDIERMGFESADRVIAVSNYTKANVIRHYGIAPDKIHVVHNATDMPADRCTSPEKKQKTVLFLGRITIQKGPEYFLHAAKKVLDYVKDTQFVMAGSGDMLVEMIGLADRLGIADNVEFPGFLTGKDIQEAYKDADVYVMPSISEPFGIAPLESMRSGTPVIISRQSGVSEVVSHCLKVDFWDIDQMANKIISILRHHPLKACLSDNGFVEASGFSWDNSAGKCVSIYREVLTGA